MRMRKMNELELILLNIMDNPNMKYQLRVKKDMLNLKIFARYPQMDYKNIPNIWIRINRKNNRLYWTISQRQPTDVLQGFDFISVSKEDAFIKVNRLSQSIMRIWKRAVK